MKYIRNISNYEEVIRESGISFSINSTEGMEHLEYILKKNEEGRDAILTKFYHKLHSGGNILENCRKIFNGIFNLQFLYDKYTWYGTGQKEFRTFCSN